jgi:excinuclease ABC subunit C
MRDTLNTLRKVFPFLTCDRQITGRDARACLYYDIGLCMAPCIGAVNPAQYRSMIVQLCRFLEGQSEPVLDELRAEMMDAADSLDYERAARLRDRIQAIERVIERQQIISPELADKDVLALARDDGSAVAQVFFVRNGKLMGREYFLLEGSEGEDDEELVASFIKQFYDSTQVPGEVIVPRYPEEARIIERWLEDRRGTRVVISLPHEERDHSLLELATENAAETLRALRSHWATEAGGSVALAELQDTLGLPAVPERIECFDVSNLQGSNPTASMVVFKAGSPARSEYRRFRIRSAATPDDYAMLREVLQRRCVRLAEARQAPGNAPASRGHGWGAAPDLLLVDGGKGQLAVAQAVVQSLGLDDIPLAALAKRQEELFVVGRGEPIVLPRNSQALFLVQRLRDEAHRFALGYHTKLRAREGLQSSLDAVPGIGRKRRQALLSHFGSLDAIRRASLDELASVSGMTRSAAQNVRAHLESV